MVSRWRQLWWQLLTMDVVPLARPATLVGHVAGSQVGAVVVLVPSVVPLAELNQLLLSVRARAEVDHETEHETVAQQAVAVRLPALLLRRTG